jgi:uncharacterized protein YbjT (DUF2867 family)
MKVLVTGGTGRLGRPLVAALRADGHEVRVLSRRAGEGHVVGDLADGRGVADAVRGCEAIVHAATSGRMKAVDVRGTDGLLRYARSGSMAHFVYVSIVGVDRNPMPYYKVKHTVEQRVAASGVPYTIARGTQFHDLVFGVGSRLRAGRVLVAPSGWQIEPHAPADFAASLVRRISAGPADAVTEFGGPEVLDAGDLITEVHRSLGRTGPVRRLALPGRISAAVAAGAQLSGPDAEHGTTTWAEWLAEKSRA